MSPSRVFEAFLICALLVIGSAVALTQTTGGAGTGAPAFVDQRQAPGLEEKAREEAARLAAEEERRRLVEETEELRRKVEQTQAKAEAERQRLAEEAEELRKAADEARRKAEAERLKREEAQNAAQETAKAQREREEFARREAAARRQAEAEAAKRAAEAEQARQAAEQEAARRRGEAEARKKVEAEAAERAAEAEQARQAAEQEATRRRAKAKAEARKKAQAEAAKSAAEAEKARQAAAEAAARRRSDAADKCKGGPPPKIASRAVAGGSMRIDIHADCQKGKRFSITYGLYSFIRAFDDDGRASFLLDLFMGTRQPIVLVLESDDNFPIEPPVVDFSGLSKVAIIWQAPVNLDLHALEYLATPGGEDHIRAGAGSSFEAASSMTAKGKGRGYMSSIAGNEDAGDKVEVYTFVRAPGQRSGVVTILVDYETRGDLPAGEACGDGPLAAIPFEVVELSPSGDINVEKRQISPAVCGQALTQAERFNPDTINDLQIRR